LKPPVLTASALSFVTAAWVNYLLCRGFVFPSGRFSRPKEIVRLFMIAFVYLGLNTAAFFPSGQNLTGQVRVAKILAVLSVRQKLRAMVFDRTVSAVMTNPNGTSA
jgi:putative flippase GtrA